jgi:hypothetical protein
MSIATRKKGGGSMGLSDSQQAYLMFASDTLIAVGVGQIAIPDGISLEGKVIIGFVLIMCAAVGKGIKEALGGKAKA